MPTYFPQITASGVITQAPYRTSQSFDTVVSQMETGQRWTFPRIGNVTLDPGYSQVPMMRFEIGYSNITDAEVAILLTFFRQMRGRWGSFRFLDPGGNLLQFSEDLSNAYWDKSVGPVTVVGPTDDFTGNMRATTLSGGGSNAYITAVIGPSDGGMSGFVMCASAWVRSSDPGAQLLIGFLDNSFTLLSYTNYDLSPSWRRIHHTAVIWDNGPMRIILGGLAQWGAGRNIDFFGIQVSPAKGEGAYVKTPGNYGYHENVRFDTESLIRRSEGPNQNQVSLPAIEFFVQSSGLTWNQETGTWNTTPGTFGD